MTLIELLDEIKDLYSDGNLNLKANIINILDEAIVKIINVKESGKETEDLLKDAKAIKSFIPHVLAYRLYLDSVK